MGVLRLGFDDGRGGFSLSLREHHGPEGTREELLGGLFSIGHAGDGRVVGVGSFWGDHGGMPLRAVHRTGAVRELRLPAMQTYESDPAGRFPLGLPDTRVGPIRVQQSPEALEIWFGFEEEFPLADWARVTDSGGGAAVYLTPETAEAGWPVPNRGRHDTVPLIGGFRFIWDRTVAAYPFTALKLSCEDYK